VLPDRTVVRYKNGLRAAASGMGSNQGGTAGPLVPDRYSRGKRGLFIFVPGICAKLTSDKKETRRGLLKWD